MRELQSQSAFKSLCGAAAIGALVIGFMAPREGRAIETYRGKVAGVCETYNNVTYNVKAFVTAPNWYVGGLQYVFTPAPAQLISADDPSGKIRYFLVSPGAYTVTVGNPNLQGTYSVTAQSCAPTPTSKGMTWRLDWTNLTTGTLDVGCGGECDAYQGDTPCTTALPLLCIKKTGPGFPLPPPASVDLTSIYHQWSGGVVGTTSAIVPPTTLAAANALCAQEFGEDWRVAEFHDGWGWYFQTYGGIGNGSSRFWVDIDDQPGATCWH
ncbi:MAG: hypothetical protein WAM82_04130 [Thermoanaerobaculia bacterium]